ncbi:hypothetical protein B566_EDAN009589, partial [Ephemera danica]
MTSIATCYEVTTSFVLPSTKRNLTSGVLKLLLSCYRIMADDAESLGVDNMLKNHKYIPEVTETFGFKRPPEAPVFRPTEEEFKNPFEYIAKIRDVASLAGICKIKPPKVIYII